jgi:PTS system fructose-specific IIC component
MLKKVTELLPRSAVKLELSSKDKKDVIAELARPLVEAGLVSDESAFLAAILRRENLESTGIGLGVAIPHARTNAVSATLLAFGRSSPGVDFSSLDGKPSHLVFLIAAPEDAKREYISTLARLSSLLRRDDVRIGLNKAQSLDDVYAVLEQNEHS